jgi:putative hydrolase of the HAD superfamily
MAAERAWLMRVNEACGGAALRPCSAAMNPASDFKSPDFRHARDWLFDLDNTLYAPGCGLLTQIEARMAAFVARHLGVDGEEAHRVRQSLYRDHGTTLNGMVQVHGIDPESFLDYVHDIDLSVLTPDARLVSGLARLPGRRLVFTNGCRHHAGRVLDRLGIAPLFNGIWDIRSLGFVPKPSPAAYDLLIAQAGIAPRQAVMFDDMTRNLAAAHALGMTTVWLNQGPLWSGDGPEAKVAPDGPIDHEIADLAGFLHAIRI